MEFSVIILIMGTSQKVTPNFGNPHIYIYVCIHKIYFSGSGVPEVGRIVLSALVIRMS